MERGFALYLKNFGIKILFCKIMKKIFWKNKSKLGYWINHQVEMIITDYLMDNITISLDTYRNISRVMDTEDSHIPRTIWIMWWQGIENAPDIVKKCVSQICKLNTYCNIYIIDKENYWNYVKVPGKILESIQNGQICYANLADIIRCQVLEHWGGVWMDATLFVTAPLDKAIFNKSFYSTTADTDQYFPSHGQWDAFFMASAPHSPVLIFVNAFLKLYFEKYDIVLDYLLIDYVIRIAYEKIPEVKACVDSIPVNNQLCHLLYQTLNQDFIKGKAFLDSDTTIFKLSWKTGISESKNGIETTYEYLMKNYFDNQQM